MTQFENNNFGDVLLNRHSVRHFHKDIKIPREELREMIKETITAPSACNLQAWQFVVVDTDEGKKKLHEFYMPFNNPKIDTSSAIIQIFGNTLAFKKYRALWDHMYEEKRISKEELDEVYNTFLPLYEHADKTMLTADAMVDSSLAAMQLMLVARAHGYETNAMAGYDAKKAASVMGLDPEQYVPVMGIAIGKPDTSVEELKSVRYPVDDVLNFE
ncbi:NADH dehydrogenase [Lactobacillus taiwanensis DSM 21401]|uniref:nitroreductase family protein n=1 Tax=Lactobacillus taiwanensis TaxID=508451 RepID=UPI0006EFE8F8|nr:nitroreductase family protein [Lactobacillus taiwanensis]KRM97851.1 NADH dehydrogenase [Lactobacillus taiwanensis DSM 21401]